MNDSHIDTLEKVRQFLGGTDEIDLEIDGKKNRYDFVKRSLMRFKYNTLNFCLTQGRPSREFSQFPSSFAPLMLK